MSGLEDAGYVNTAIPRDRLKRPLVLPPVIDPKYPDKRRAYQRVTTFAGIIDETYNLEQHGKRLVAWGMGQRNDLQLLAASIQDPELAKAQLNEIHDEASKYARETFKSNIGTALHQFCESLDRGETIRNVPAEIAADLAAYQQATSMFKVHEIESFRVFDDWQLAGTADRVVEWEGSYYIADIKSGRIDYPRKMALQLAVYAHAKRYDVATDRRVEVPYQVNLDKAIIIHLPPGEGRCTLHWLDIRKGWAGCGLAYRVREFRKESKQKDLIWEANLEGEQFDWTSTQEAHLNDQDYYIGMVQIASDVDELVVIWRTAKANGSDTPEFLAACAARKRQLLSAVA